MCAALLTLHVLTLSPFSSCHTFRSELGCCQKSEDATYSSGSYTEEYPSGAKCVWSASYHSPVVITDHTKKTGKATGVW